jgi:site-specific DNA-cytosine methylase
MLFYDSFAGGCNVSFAAKSLGFTVKSSDKYIRCFPDVELRDFRSIQFEPGAVAWFSPPCVDYSIANPRRGLSDSVLFENDSITELSTIIVENVPSFRTPANVERLKQLSRAMRSHLAYGCLNLWEYGSLQQRRRFFAVLTRDRAVWQAMSDGMPKVDSSQTLRNFWHLASFLGDEGGGDRNCPEGAYRLHTSWGAGRYYSRELPFPTFTRSSLSRRYAFKTREFGFPSSEMWRLDGFPLPLECIVDDRTLSMSVVGDGVPYRFVHSLLSHLFGERASA